MQRIPITLATPGMILAREVVTEDGKILCGPGIELTMGLIDRLSASQIASVTVEGRPVHLPGEKDIRERIKDLEYRFSRVKDDPVLRALKKLIAQHWIDSERSSKPKIQKVP